MLDTRLPIWWVSDDERLSDKARQALARESGGAAGQIIESAITPSEIAMLQVAGRVVCP